MKQDASHTGCQSFASVFSVSGFCCTMRISKTAWALGLALPCSLQPHQYLT